MTSHQNAVCNSCRVRKVKCDRDDPCGNCVDGNISCLRTSYLRQSRNASRRRRTAELKTAHSKGNSLRDVSPSPSNYSSTVSESPSVFEAQDLIRRQIGAGQYMSPERVGVLNSAMAFVSHLLRATKPDIHNAHATRVANVMEGIVYPSIELLYWMLRELKGNNIGPHVLDYFKHVSPGSLRTMGRALIDRSGSPEILLLYSICVNSAAYKFINTVLSGSDIGDVEDGMRSQAATYLSSVKTAMARIQLLSPPSLVFLQALLCSAFIAQGTGDSTSCWAFVSAACKVCGDLGLQPRIEACSARTEDDEEAFYCYIWCHILDKNYSMMLGRRLCLLEADGMDLAFSHPFNQSMSALLTTYLHFVPIQAQFISELHPSKIVDDSSLVTSVEVIVHDLLERLQRVHARITALHGPSSSWDGLHEASELNTIQFSYHSLRTSILRSRQICLPTKPHIDSECLESARMAMGTLRAIQESSMTIDIRSHIAYMNWTALFHPLTPFFVMFCNIVATSDREDFQTLELVTSQLDGLVELSPSISRLQALFQTFVGLCKGLVVDVKDNHSPTIREEERLTQGRPAQDIGTTSYPFASPSDAQTYPDQPGSAFSSQRTPSTVPTPLGLRGPYDDLIPPVDPDWGLFDMQPTLDWLDADFSFFSSNQ
ncbi:hypothetical protein P171DRAFT_434189 [Karstenula rhodostoma CBS 690.94]|uniref:Zn(2)-C6 fungal-type domain-containing protein n=1 Tax=Karstenula rhodostoma CBS 690.94 TaxID=1392251 RepID=A0A9P4PE54_9PLEO|nr:hypothetical protein P171DRAFT_434189 [Karstenula rhodostoma CBS 690.94]